MSTCSNPTGVDQVRERRFTPDPSQGSVPNTRGYVQICTPRMCAPHVALFGQKIESGAGKVIWCTRCPAFFPPPPNPRQINIFFRLKSFTPRCCRLQTSKAPSHHFPTHNVLFYCPTHGQCALINLIRRGILYSVTVLFSCSTIHVFGMWHVRVCMYVYTCMCVVHYVCVPGRVRV